MQSQVVFEMVVLLDLGIFLRKQVVIDSSLSNSKHQSIDVDHNGDHRLTIFLLTMWMLRKSFNLNTRFAIRTEKG